MSEFAHTTVLRDETVELLRVKPGGLYVDCTLGGGGHTERILEQSSPDGRVVGLDRDEVALAAARERLAGFGDRVTYVHATFSELPNVLSRLGHAAVDGIVADLGVSSPQLDEASRGFAFGKSGPLDMRMDASQGETAKELIERLDDRELANVLYEYGEERKSRPVARAIKRSEAEGRLETTEDLVRAVRSVLGPNRGKGEPSARTFQALRIAVNGELDQLESLLARGPDLLEPGGVLAVISFHSLEDRLVKHGFRDDARLEVLTKKPIVASEAESSANPRSRSAKLRGARRLEGGAS